MSEGLFGALALAAATVGALHSIAPDHWVPFAAVARARGWSAARTTRVTLLCGFGHVTVSAAMGLLALFLGREVLETFGSRMESIAGILMIAFGLVYGIWGLRRAAGEKLHGHSHSHYDHVHDPSKVTVLGMFLLFCADPCVAVIPIMVALVLPARAGINVLKARWLDHYGDAAAGGVIVAVGVVVAGLGW